MMKVMFSENERMDKLIKRWVGIFVLVSFLVTGATWFGGWFDPMIATEPEVHEIVETHDEQQNYARIGSVNHLANMMVDEQIGDATSFVESIEDLEDLGEATPEQIREKIREGKRIEEDFMPGYICEPGADSEHYQKKHKKMDSDEWSGCIRQDALERAARDGS